MAAKRRGHGEGSIYRRADGLWVGSVDLGWDASGKRRRKAVSSRTQAGVIEKLRDTQGRVSSGLPAGDDRITVQTLIERWPEDVVEARVSPGTSASYRFLAERYIYPSLGRRQIAKLTPLDVQRFLTEKAKELQSRRRRTRENTSGEIQSLSPRTVQMIRGVLSQALGQAERWGLDARNVVKLTDPPRQQRREGRALSIEQANELLADAAGDRLEATISVGLSLGLRRGELLGLRPDHVDLDAPVVYAAPSERERGTLVYGELKTARSRRTLDLPAPVRALTSCGTGAHGSRAPRGAGQPGGIRATCFTTQIGTPTDQAPDNFFQGLQGHRSGPTPGLRDSHLHELRHSSASLLLAEGGCGSRQRHRTTLG